MIELISLSRILVDYFWEYKALSILHTAMSLAVALILLIYFKRNSFRTCNSDKFAILFSLFAAIAFAMDVNEGTSIEFLKLTTYLSFYFVGRLIPLQLKNSRLLGLFSVASLIFLATLALTGQGYTAWGSVRTFTGGYFFKTDLAIASLIFLTLAFATLQKKIILAIALLCAAYLVFKSNARIALPLVVIIPAFVVMALRGAIIGMSSRAVPAAIFAAMAGIALFALIDFQRMGMLGFDFSDPLSAANTQGRSVIWAALLQAYTDASLTKQLIGMGFGADSRATTIFSESLTLEGVRAHNSYLYLLLSMGIVGSASFYWVIYSIFAKTPFLLKQTNRKLRILPTISCSFLILFIWLSMTTEIIIRPQLMILLFFFSGLHVQSYLKLKESIRGHARALANRA